MSFFPNGLLKWATWREFREAGEICILDDDPSILRSPKELLSSDDFEAEVFDDPEKFLEYVRAHAVRLAILDVWMQRQSGIQLQVQLHHLSPKSRVIIITGREEPAIGDIAGGQHVLLASQRSSF